MRFAALAVLMLVAACQASPPEGLSDADRAAIDELAASYRAAVRAGDWTAWTELWTTDGVFQILEAPAIVGREEILAKYQTFRVPTEMDLTISDVDGSGKWAWARGTWFFLAPATEEMPEIRMVGSFLWVLEKQSDGNWLIDTECENLDTPSDMPVEG